MTYSWKNPPHKHDEEYYMIVGYLSVQWNHFESALSSLTCAVAGIDFNERHTFLRHFGNVSICEFLRDIATSRSRNEDAHRAINAACAAFDVLRVNRNLVVHNNMTLEQNVDGDWQEIIRSKPTNKMKNARTDLVSRDRIKQTIDEIEEWGMYFHRLATWYHFDQIESQSYPMPKSPDQPMTLKTNRKSQHQGN